MSKDSTTIKVSEPTGDLWVPRTPALTVLFHPDVRRVGEVARLERHTKLSRSQPKFSLPGGKTAKALGDGALSRRAIALEHTAGRAMRVVPASGGSDARVAGKPLGSEVELDRDQLAHGVVIELQNRVVLLCHLVGPKRERVDNMGIVGHAGAIAELRDDIRRVADLPHAVLIVGESGSGKELVAQAIHRASKRDKGPCVCVNMATIPSSTAASQLFGHSRGSFTGAQTAHSGYFARAHSGTLFLDEIGDTPLDVQAMLLRAIETGEVQPLGADEATRVDVRLIAATDADLERAVHEKSFRRPLLHRLSSVVLTVPPLRKRREDIGRLFFHFLRSELELIGELERLRPPETVAPTWIPASLLAELARFDWPGNVRQLRNVARQLAVANRGESRFRAPPALGRMLASPAMPEPKTGSHATIAGDSGGDAESSGRAGARAAKRDIAAIDEDELIAALRKCRWQPSRTAAYLGISRTALYKLMNRSKRIRRARDYSREQIQACADECLGDLDVMAERLEVSKRGLQLRMAELDMITA